MIKVLKKQPLDFFLMLSSLVSILGHLSQANYGAGNAFMDGIANTAEMSGTHFIALNPGPIGDAGMLKKTPRVKKILLRQGYIMLKVKELLAAVEYAMSPEARRDQCRQVILGFDYQYFTESGNEHALKNPMFCHLSRSRDSCETSRNDTVVESIECAISAAEGVEQVETIILKSVATKISTLVAVGYEDIDIQKRPIEFGLDSLVVIELKNWIAQTFQAKLQPHEISDAANIIALATLIALRSELARNKSSVEKSNDDSNEIEAKPSRHDRPEIHYHSTIFPKQPLPDLDQSLDHYLEAVRPIFTEEEYVTMVGHVEDFRKPGGFGRELQERLSRLANDPSVDNWQLELYNDGVHLTGRAPLIPCDNFFGSHPPSPYPHSAAERAAIIASATFEFKQKLEAGELEYEMINEQPVGKYFYEWFFNSTREPRIGRDEVMKYPGNDYLVAFRHGHVFKIPLRNVDGPTSYGELKDTFRGILDTEKRPDSWVGILTADDRDSWAKVSCVKSSAL